VRRVRLAVLGGTFDHLHVGHQALLASAFRTGRTVAVGLTTDRFVADHPKPFPQRIQTYAARRAALMRWIRTNFPRRTWWLVPLQDPFGRSVEPGVDLLVVSHDTAAGGRAVNRERRRLGRPPVRLLVVPLALADDLEPVSSRRVRARTIRPNGHRISPIGIALAVSDPRDRPVAERAVRQVFPRARILGPNPRIPLRVGADITLRIARRPGGGWNVTESSPRVRLRPQFVPGSRSADLQRGLLSLLRPR